jgi:hypothetical protein
MAEARNTKSETNSKLKYPMTETLLRFGLETGVWRRNKANLRGQHARDTRRRDAFDTASAPNKASWRPGAQFQV